MNPLERLALIVQSNQSLHEQLVISRLNIQRALNYLDKPHANPRVGIAHLERHRRRHNEILACLRLNRVEGLRLLGGSIDA